MVGPLMAFLVAVGIVSVIFYRLHNRPPERRWSSGTGGRDVGFSSDTGSSTWSFGEWFSSSSSSDVSGNPSDGGGSSGSWDSGGSDGGGSDSGGGGDSGSGSSD